MSKFNSEDGIEKGVVCRVTGSYTENMTHNLPIDELVTLIGDDGTDCPFFDSVDEEGFPQYIHLNNVEPVE
jgi:hypothetical protein